MDSLSQALGQAGVERLTFEQFYALEFDRVFNPSQASALRPPPPLRPRQLDFQRRPLLIVLLRAT